MNVVEALISKELVENRFFLLLSNVLQMVELNDKPFMPLLKKREDKRKERGGEGRR